MRLWISLIAATVVLCPLHAQRGQLEVVGSAGHACFVDESFCDVPHSFVGASGRLYFTRNWAFQPEFTFAQGPGPDHDYLMIGNLSWDFGPSERVKPYYIFGGGVLEHRGMYGVRGKSWTFGGGFGVKIYVSKNVFLSPEVRLGWEPFLRFGAGVGYTFGKR